MFRETARAIFEAVVADVPSPQALLDGLAQGVDEGRILIAPFRDQDRRRLADTPMLGELSGDDGVVPHVDVAINDATAGKMSYYLRFSSEVSAISCTDGIQRIEGVTSAQPDPARQPPRATQLPPYVLGPEGGFVPRGAQLDIITLYAPFGGSIERVTLDGKKLPVVILDHDGRPAVQLHRAVGRERATHVRVGDDRGRGADRRPGAALDARHGAGPGRGDRPLRRVAD